MRKNKDAFPKLKIFSTYEVRGVNFDGLLNALARNGVTVYGVKKIAEKRYILSVNFTQNRKFFAIARDLCYTDIKKIKDGGRGFFLLYFFRNIGLVAGALIFFALAAVFGDMVFTVSYTGSGSVCKADISRYLDERGVDTFTRFSEVDLARLSDGILADNPRLSFVECRKKGNVLEIESVLSPESPEPFKTAEELKAPGSGTVKDVKVYRGAALVKPGDTVREGDVLVTGTVTVKDVPVNVGVIARVTLACQTQCVYLSEREGEEELAVMLAEESLELAGAEYSVISAREGDKVVYTVCVNYALVLFSG